MDLEKIRKYCLKKAGVTEGFPFGEEMLVFKAGGKMFCLAALSHPATLNLKCDPEKAVQLREKYDSVAPGYHMNKTHWNTVTLDGSIPDSEVLSWIDDSYNLILAKLPKSTRVRLD
jgi:predicted DNA-binding protein (MmcQ/YjbR family)